MTSMSNGARVAIALFTMVTAAVFGWLATARRAGATQPFDLAVRARVHGMASPALTASARGLAAVGSPLVVSMFFAIAMVVFHRLHWRPVVIALAAHTPDAAARIAICLAAALLVAGVGWSRV